MFLSTLKSDSEMPIFYESALLLVKKKKKKNSISWFVWILTFEASVIKFMCSLFIYIGSESDLNLGTLQ